MDISYCLLLFLKFNTHHGCHTVMNPDGVGDVNMHGIHVSHSIVEFDDVGLAWYAMWIISGYLIVFCESMVRM